jgi:hypothetical protein
MKKNKIHIVWGIVAVIALIGGFFWGKGMAGAAGSAGRGGNFGAFGGSSTRGGFRGANGGLAGGGFVAGQVTAIDASSITLQLPNGNSENVFYSSSTQVIVPQSASISSVQPGTMVMVGGTQNSDGSMTASSIQVRNGNIPGGGSRTGAAGAGTAPGASQ